MKRDSGFTLVELLVVMAIMGILASMAVTSLLRARSAANESSAIGSLRTVTQGQVLYANTCGYGNFATSLPILGIAPPGSKAFLPPDLTAAAIVQKSGYRFQLAPSLGSAAGQLDCNDTPTRTGFYARSEPIAYGSSGSRSFATLSPTNVIWQLFSANAPTEPFGAPATPVR